MAGKRNSLDDRIAKAEARVFKLKDNLDQALEELNKYVKELVDKGNLVITYNGKPTKIILPIKEYNCGNIFDDGPYPFWDGVEIWCKIPNVKSSDFTCNKLRAEIRPACWTPERTVW